MQTVSAYPSGPLPAATCHVRRAAEFGLPLCSDALLIGPGTRHEVDELMSVYQRTRGAPTPRIKVLTLSADEIGGLRDFDSTLGDIHDAPFANASFDLIFSSNVFEHAIAPHVALLECRRMLRPGGTFYMIVPTFETPGGGCTPWHVYCLAADNWHELLHKAGLRVDFVQSRVVETLEGGANESYHHFRAVAVDPPEPHDEILRRISALKAAVP